MRRAERLFRLVQLLRRFKVTTARRLASELELSERTIYRDMQDLMSSGVPVHSQSGVGYALGKGFDLPPMMFTTEEIEALVLGARIVASWTDASFANSATAALEKIEAVLPEHLKPGLEHTSLFAPKRPLPAVVSANLATARAAIGATQKIHFTYIKPNAPRTERTVHPIGLFFWGSVWTLVAWCELRQAFRSFRLDRIEGTRILDETFEPATGHTLENFFLYVAETVGRPVEDIMEKVRP